MSGRYEIVSCSATEFYRAVSAGKYDHLRLISITATGLDNSFIIAVFEKEKR